MFARRALRRPGIGLVGATLLGAGASAGSSATNHSAQETAQLDAQPLPEAMVPAEAPKASSSVLTDEKMMQIRKLGEMKKEGLLTYMEFEAQKQRLLS